MTEIGICLASRLEKKYAGEIFSFISGPLKRFTSGLECFCRNYFPLQHCGVIPHKLVGGRGKNRVITEAQNPQSV